MYQIIEEQLTFPSGTATAQLISVLHKLPPPDTTIRQRRGYRQLDTEEDTTTVNEDQTAENDEETEDVNVRETVQHDGWRSLSWSFIASGSLTVRRYPCQLCRKLTSKSSLPTFSQSFLRSRYSEIIWQASGFGTLRQACLMLVKVGHQMAASSTRYSSFYRNYYGISNYPEHESSEL